MTHSDPPTIRGGEPNRSRNADNLSESTVSSVILPVVVEELDVKKESVEKARVVVRVTPESEERSVDVELSSETIEIERVPINRVVERESGPRHEGDVTVIPVFEEVLVVEKRLVLKEEIRMTRRRSQSTERVTETVRRERVDIQRHPS